MSAFICRYVANYSKSPQQWVFLERQQAGRHPEWRLSAARGPITQQVNNYSCGDKEDQGEEVEKEEGKAVTIIHNFHF